MSIISNIFTFKSRSTPVQLEPLQISSSIGADEILIDTKYTALNPADVKLKSIAFIPWNYRTVRDFSGYIIAAGENAIKKFPLGTQVCGSHLLGSAVVGSVTKINVEKHAVLTKPKSLSLGQAAALPSVFGTAYNMTKACSKIDPQSSALVLGGSGSVGSLVIQLLKREYKVSRVVSSCSSESSKFVKSVGAQETVDYHQPDFQQQLVTAAGPEKFQNIFDCVGGYDALEMSDKILQPVNRGSSYITVSGDAPFNQKHSNAMASFLTAVPRMVFRSIFGKQYGINYKFVFLDNKNWPEIGPSLIDRHKIKVPIDSEFKAVEVGAAFEHLDLGKVKGKVILHFE